MAKKTQQPTVERKTALCYVRLSVNKNGTDATSPERQKANIAAACLKLGLIPEWYEDTTGHKSATKENNRPGWLALKTRLNDPDVAAIVVNDLSRAMRNAWRAIKLFEELPAYGVYLYMAIADRRIDITSPDGRLSAFMTAFTDDYYAIEASRRAKDSVKYRKSKGVSIGIPPFGTIRDEKGFLIPSPFGAWFMPDCSFIAGKEADPAPAPDAVWRGYYQCAEAILKLYKENLHGYDFIADRMNEQGYTFRDRWNKPRPVKLDDVRRVVSNWREYAGMVKGGRAKEKIADQIENPSAELYDTGRAVFPITLLREVAQVQEQRSLTTNPSGAPKIAHIFPLSALLYCAHCERQAIEAADLKLRSTIIGWNAGGKLRYRHSEKKHCAAKQRTIFAHIIEDDFYRLIKLLHISPDAIDLMAEIAVQSQFSDLQKQDEAQFEEEKRIAIAKHHRALKNLRNMNMRGELDDADYLREKDFNERQIAHLESMVTDAQQIRMEFTACAELLTRIQEFWHVSEGEDRKILAHSLFDEITYDMSTKRIVDFKVKVWAERFLVMRAALYEDQMGLEMKNRFNSGASSEVSYFDPSGKELEHLSSLNSLLIEFLQCIAFPQNAQFALLETS